MSQYLAVTSRGLENLLEQELKSFGIEKIVQLQAGVKFTATNQQIYQCCLWSRVASRFIKILSEFNCIQEIDLYQAASVIPWSNHFTPRKRFIVDFNGTNKVIRNSHYGALKIKDAIMDKCRDKLQLEVCKQRPDLRVHARLFKDKVILGIDMVGESLHRRGYRTQAGKAPMRETLAAAMILRSDWQAQRDLFDPMCGSGTIIIEAAMIAADMAPGLNRKYWPFEKLPDFQREEWLALKTAAQVRARKGVRNVTAQFYAQDVDASMIQLAQENARRAGVNELIQFQVGDVASLICPSVFNGDLITNPPYGERLGQEASLIALYTAFGGQLKANFQGSTAYVLSSSDDLLSCLGMRAEKQYTLYNGALRCHFKRYPITQKLDNKDATNNKMVATDFANRLKKNVQKIEKWAKKEQLDCYRLYDADLPEYNVAIDRYQEYVVIQEYAAPKNIAVEKAKRRLTDIIRATLATLSLASDQLILKTREKQKGSNQYQKLAETDAYFTVHEYGVQLLVNLYNYLDTGLFLDHRLTRRMLGEMAQGKDFLNLFAYTGSATVHAACAGAKSTTTVDMSKTYLDWSKRNMALNKQQGKQHEFIHADCLAWLSVTQKQFDLIFVDPPTFSNSKRMEKDFDVQRDHVTLIQALLPLLRPHGKIIFSNNKRQFKMDFDQLAVMGVQAENISSQTQSLDFVRNQHIHNCWQITRDQA